MIAATFLAITILFYILIYTIWLKRKTAQNIVIGGGAGALPPIIGWLIVTGSLELEPIILFCVYFEVSNMEFSTDLNAAICIIESIESVNYRWCIGVQWHPEFCITKADKLIFLDFLKNCKIK